MNDLDWIANRTFREAIWAEYRWVFAFDNGIRVIANCFWRFLENGRIHVTSEDDGHVFGLPAPVDATVEINLRLTGTAAIAVVLHEGTLDLEILFDTGHKLQIIPDSSGYEAWEAIDPTRQFIALGGGDLVVFGPTDGGS